MDDTNDDFRYSAALELKGLEAEGCADRWLKYARRTLNEYKGTRHRDIAARTEELLTPWIEGKYENLKRHEERQVRLGRIAEIDADAKQGAVREAYDIAKLAAASDETWAEVAKRNRDVLDEQLRSGIDKDAAQAEYDKAMRLVAQGRADDATRHVVQIAATSEMGAGRFEQAVRDGLYDEKEGRMRLNRYRRDVLANAISALTEDGRADQAEAFLGALEAHDGAVAKECNFTVAELAKFRKAIAATRKRNEAARAEEAARTRQLAMEEIAKADIESARRPFPEDAAARKSQAEQEAERYNRYADDERLDAATRAKYAEAARNVLAAEKKLSEAERAAEVKRAARMYGAWQKSRQNAAKEAKRREKELVEDRKRAIVAIEAHAMRLRGTGSESDARRANELESELYHSVTKAFVENTIPAETYVAYRERRAKQLRADECRAMTILDRELGLDVDVDDGGEAKRTSSLDKRIVLGDNKKYDSETVLKYRRKLLAELRRLGKDISREEVMRGAVDRILAEAYAEKFDWESADAAIAALEGMQTDIRAESSTSRNYGAPRGPSVKSDKEDRK